MSTRRTRGLGDIHQLVCSRSKTNLYRVRLDQGGYDEVGRYWGRGQPLFEFVNDDSQGHLRAASRDDAKRQMRTKCPGLKFYR